MDPSKHADIIRSLRNEGNIITDRIEKIMLSVDFKQYRSSTLFPGPILEMFKDHLFEGQNVLFINSSSAYTGVCMAQMVGETGKVIFSYTERNMEAEMSQQISTFHPRLLNKQIEFIFLGNNEKYLDYGPYNAIFVYALVKKVPEEFLKHLKPLGRLLIYREEKERIIMELIDKTEKGITRKKLKKDLDKINLVSIDKLIEKLKHKSEKASHPKDCDIFRIKDLVDCPICFGQISPPTAICYNGHTICGECRTKLQKCPTCEAEYSHVRLLLLDKILEEITHSCRAVDLGCKAKLNVNDIKAHEAECEFLNTVTCRIGSCNTKMQAIGYCNHIRLKHRDNFMYDANFPVKLEFTESTDWKEGTKVTIIEEKYSSDMFEFHVRTTEDKLSIAVKYVGPKEVRNRYKVDITLNWEQKMTKQTSAFDFDAEYEVLWGSPNFVITKALCEVYSKGSLPFLCYVERLPR